MADFHQTCKQSTQTSIYSIKDEANYKKKGSCRITNESSYKFVIKLKELLSYEQISDAISWNNDGTVIEIRNEQRFTNDVLPMFFKIHTLSNFIRQLNLYRFKKIRNYKDKNAKAYSNPFFKRDSYDFNKITRASQKKKFVKLEDDVATLKVSVRKIRLLNKKLVFLKKKQEYNYFTSSELKENLANMDTYSNKLEFILFGLIHYSALSNININSESKSDLFLNLLDSLRSSIPESFGSLSNTDLSKHIELLQSTTLDNSIEATANQATFEKANISFTTHSTFEKLQLKADSFKNRNESFNHISAVQHDYYIEQDFNDYFLSN